MGGDLRFLELFSNGKIMENVHKAMDRIEATGPRVHHGPRGGATGRLPESAPVAAAGVLD